MIRSELRSPLEIVGTTLIKEQEVFHARALLSAAGKADNYRQGAVYINPF